MIKCNAKVLSNSRDNATNTNGSTYTITYQPNPPLQPTSQGYFFIVQKAFEKIEIIKGNGFITYTFNARSLSNEAISFDDLYLLNCILNNEEVALGRWLQ